MIKVYTQSSYTFEIDHEDYRLMADMLAAVANGVESSVANQNIASALMAAMRHSTEAIK